MDSHRSDDHVVSRSDGISRRQVLLRLGAGGLAVALAAHGIEAAHAQNATPPAGGGLPPGMSATPLFGVPIKDLPTTPFTIQLTRFTLEPGTVVPNSAFPYPSITYVEAGEKVVCPPAGEGRFLYGLDGKLIASGGGEFAFPVGTACYTSPNTLDGVRNDGTDRASLLGIDLIPATEGTPTS